MTTTLSQCMEGDTVTIVQLLGVGLFRKRLIELGFRRGAVLTVVRYAPLRDPMEVELSGNHISLRVEEAKLIEVRKGEGSNER